MKAGLHLRNAMEAAQAMHRLRSEEKSGAMDVERKNERVVILAAVDRSPVSDSAIGTACAVAASMRGAELHFVHVLAPTVFPSGPAIPPPPTSVEDAGLFIGSVKRRAAELFAGPITAHLATGKAHERIVEVAAELDADLIVVGSGGRSGIARWMHRSVAQRVANDAPCAVLVARPKEHGVAPPEIEPPAARVRAHS